MTRPISRRLHPAIALGAALLFFCVARSAPADQPLAGQAKTIFAAKCAECHSPNASNEKESRKARKKWSDFTDLVELKSKQFEATVQPAKTTLWKTLDDKDMPPDDAKAGPLTADELATIKRWMVAGAPTNTGPARTIEIVSDDKLLRIILADLLSDKVPEIKRQTTRYFTFANFYNNPDESEERLDLYRQGLFKMVNSLSWQSDMVLPEKVDKDGVVWRINLRDLGWTEQLWEHLISAYPYGIDFENGVGKSISTLTSSRLPYLRADWFVFATSQPPFYHEFLGLDGPQGALAGLEKRLNVDRIANIQNGNAARAAIQAGVSGVSRNNRLVERHGGAVGGYYWISYDFSSNLNEQDLPANPLGPPEAFHGPLVFQHKGGEIVFALPNHLQGYLLVKFDGTRLDTAPPDIVFDANSPSPRAGEIINGISCISCHDHGIKEKVSDEVRARAAADSARFSGPTRELIDALYKEKPVMDGLLHKDLQQFVKALGEAQCPSVNSAGVFVEPVRVVYDRFAKSNVDVNSAAAELGLGEAEFTERLTDNGLRGLLSEFKGAGVPRDKFIDKFDKIVVTLSIGLHRSFEPVVGIRLVEADLSTPRKAGIAFAKAMQAGDASAVKSLAFGSDADFALASGLSDFLVAMKNLQDGADRKFGATSKLPADLAIDMAGELETADEKIDGDQATLVTRRKPDDKFPLTLKRESDKWKVDLFSSFGKDPQSAEFAAIGPAMVKGVDEVIRNIAREKYKTRDEMLVDLLEHIGAATKLATFTSPTAGMKFATIIAPGQQVVFMMGCPAIEPGRGDDETLHKVTLTHPFRMATTHVTRGQFAAFVADSGYKTDAEKEGKAFVFDGTDFNDVAGACWRNPGFEQTDEHPAVVLSWNDAMEFCKWLCAKDRKKYRFPTEAEWEYACRGGTQTAYFWGDNPDAGQGFVNGADITGKDKFHQSDSFNFRDGFVFTSPVGSFKPNKFGLYDMSGNEWQWVSDCWGENPPGDAIDPTGPAAVRNVELHMLRGGSWHEGSAGCRAASRTPHGEGGASFRLCLDF